MRAELETMDREHVFVSFWIVEGGGLADREELGGNDAERMVPLLGRGVLFGVLPLLGRGVRLGVLPLLGRGVLFGVLPLLGRGVRAGVFPLLGRGVLLGVLPSLGRGVRVAVLPLLGRGGGVFNPDNPDVHPPFITSSFCFLLTLLTSG
jgi:hypothetical protein